MEHISSDTHTILPADVSAALWSERDGFSVLISCGLDRVPEPLVAMMACVERLTSDPEFVRDMIEWVEAKPKH